MYSLTSLVVKQWTSDAILRVDGVADIHQMINYVTVRFDWHGRQTADQ
jgi:hypothetical protein